MVEKTLSAHIYPEECLLDASRHFEHLCRTSWTRTATGFQVRIEPLPGSPGETVDEFLNYLLAASLEQHLL